MPISDEILPLNLADVVFPQDHPLKGQTGAVLAFLIRSDDAALLFDTGIGEGNQGLDEQYNVVRRSLPAALAQHGVSAEDVSAIVNSHLHFDHCGNNRLFPGVTIYAQASESEAATQPGYTIADWVGPPKAQYFRLDGDHQLSDSLRIISTPGHTPGHQSLLVKTKRRLELIAGQAIYSSLEYDQIREAGLIPPEAQMSDLEARSALGLIGFQAQRVHFSHDVNSWELTK